MSEIEARVKDKLLEMIERVVDDPSIVPDEWKLYFGEASIMRAMAIVSKLKGRPADDAATVSDGATGLDPQETQMLVEWLLQKGDVFCPDCKERREKCGKIDRP